MVSLLLLGFLPGFPLPLLLWSLVVDVAGVFVVLVSLLLLGVVGLLIEVPLLRKKYWNNRLINCSYQDVAYIGQATFDFRYSNSYRTGKILRTTAFIQFFMYQRPILCNVFGAVDFLNVLKKGCWGGGGGVIGT